MKTKKAKRFQFMAMWSISTDHTGFLTHCHCTIILWFWFYGLQLCGGCYILSFFCIFFKFLTFFVVPIMWYWGHAGEVSLPHFASLFVIYFVVLLCFSNWYIILIILIVYIKWAFQVLMLSSHSGSIKITVKTWSCMLVFF